MDYKQKLTSDFNDFDELLNNPNHVIRRYYSAFLNGDYGIEIYHKWLSRYNKINTTKQLRSFVIQSFCEYNALDYYCKPQQVQRWLVKNIGVEKLEQLNNWLIEDVKDVYFDIKVMN